MYVGSLKRSCRLFKKTFGRLLEEVDDLKAKKKTLLKLRRACLLKNNPYDLQR